MEVAKLLIKKGASVDAIASWCPTFKKYEWTPLSYAVAAGHMPVVKLLLAEGADAKKSGFTSPPRWLKTSGHHEEIFKLLNRKVTDTPD